MFLEIGSQFVADSQIHTVNKRFRKNGNVTYIDEQGNRHAANQVQPIDPEIPLTEPDLITLTMMVAAMTESGEFELDLLETLNPTQKRQLWDALNPNQREALKQARKAAA